MMNDRQHFEIVCPNGHEQTVVFTKIGFETALKAGAMVFHCHTCDTNWPPSHKEITKIRKELAEDLAIAK